MPAGSGSFTLLNHSIVCCFASCLETFLCSCIASATCSPQQSTGFNDVIGSWNIIAILCPLIFCRSFAFFCKRSIALLLSSEKNIFPDKYLAGGDGSNCKMESAVTDLPDPDLPT